MSEAIKLFQYNTLGALMAGLYGGTLTVGELLEHGDLGLGTLDSIDGELIVLDGKAYQAKGSEGKVEVVEVSPDEKVPYAAVVPHQAEVIFRQRYEMTDKELEDRIESYYDGVNLFRSIKIKGHFKHMHVRMIPKSNADIKFADVATRQPEYEVDDISGTIVGIWTPEMFHGVSVAGYHLHFISEDLTFGGHVMDFVIENGIIEVGPVDQLDQRFPVQDRQYLFAKFNVDEMREDITKAEAMLDFVKKAKSYGIRIAIDDFGSGFSNFTHIVKMNPDYLKIDGSIIKDVVSNSKSQAMLKAIVNFASELGLKTIAEFIHNEETYNYCKEHGVDSFQGFYLGEPKPIAGCSIA